MKELYSLVGMHHRGTQKFVASLPDREPLTLIREPNNQYDANAIQVWARDQHVGYIKASENAALAAYIDDYGMLAVDEPGNSLSAVLVAGHFPQVEINK